MAATTQTDLDNRPMKTAARKKLSVTVATATSSTEWSNSDAIVEGNIARLHYNVPSLAGTSGQNTTATFILKDEDGNVLVTKTGLGKSSHTVVNLMPTGLAYCGILSLTATTNVAQSVSSTFNVVATML